MKINKIHLSILLIIILGIVLRFFIIGNYPYKDEFDFINGQRIYLNGGEGLQFVPVHPPMWYIIMHPFYTLFGVVGLRLAMIICGIIITIFTYLLAKELFDKEKAIISTLILTFTFWFLIANTMIDTDGGILSMFLIITIFNIIKYEKTKKDKYLIYAGIFLGIALLTKYTAIVIIPPIIALFFIRQKENKFISKEVFKKSLIVFATAFCIFSIFPIISLITNPTIFLRTITHGQEVLSIIPNVKAFIFILIWGTSIMFLLPIIFIEFYKSENSVTIKNKFNKIFNIESKKNDKSIKKSENKNNSIEKTNSDLPIILYLIIIITFIAGFFMKSFMALDRIYTIFIPYCAILFGAYLVDNNKYIKKSILLISSIIFLTIFFVSSIFKPELITHSYSTYISRTIHLSWNFLFPIRGSSGPMLTVPFAIIGISIFIGLITLSMFLLTKRKNYAKNLKSRKIFFSIFLGICIATNIYLITEYVFHPTTPNIDYTIKQMDEYIKINKLEIEAYSDNIYILKGNPYIITESNVFNESSPKISAVLNFPKQEVNIDKSCSTMKTFSDKGYEFAYIFNCKNINN